MDAGWNREGAKRTPSCCKFSEIYWDLVRFTGVRAAISKRSGGCANSQAE